MNKTYNERKKNGLCVNCGQQPEAGKLRCELCKIKNRDYAKAWAKDHPGCHTKARRKKLGLCECGAVPDDGFRMCGKCRVAACEKQKRHARRKKESGLCQCGKPASPGRWACPECRESHRLRSVRRKLAGICGHCKNPSVPGKTHCATCAREAADHAKKKGREFKKAVFDHYGRVCKCCGEQTTEFLTIDHVNGGGTKHRKELGTKSGTYFYRWLVRQGFPEGYQTLCYNCNCAKGFYGECPHERERREQTESSSEG